MSRSWSYNCVRLFRVIIVVSFNSRKILVRRYLIVDVFKLEQARINQVATNCDFDKSKSIIPTLNTTSKEPIEFVSITFAFVVYIEAIPSLTNLYFLIMLVSSPTKVFELVNVPFFHLKLDRKCKVIIFCMFYMETITILFYIKNAWKLYNLHMCYMLKTYKRCTLKIPH